ncbi:MAG: hypothetical protein ACQERJ_00150 [Bacillota bacterium]
MRLAKKTIVLSVVLLLLLSMTAVAEEIKLSSPIRNSYPFLYWENSEFKGMHIDIVKDALKNLGYDFSIQGFPIKRCVRKAEKGEVDAIISIPYEGDYSQLDFPPDADVDSESKWRIMQVDNVVVSYADNDYKFEGDVDSLPTPIRIVYGENLLERELKKRDVRVEKVKTNLQNFRKLIRDEKGVLITTTVTAENMYQNPKFRDRIKIHHIPVTSLSHHLAFSKESSLTGEEKQQIWNEIANLRNDYVYMLRLYAQY